MLRDRRKTLHESGWKGFAAAQPGGQLAIGPRQHRVIGCFRQRGDRFGNRDAARHQSVQLFQGGCVVSPGEPPAAAGCLGRPGGGVDYGRLDTAPQQVAMRAAFGNGLDQTAYQLSVAL